MSASAGLSSCVLLGVARPFGAASGVWPTLSRLRKAPLLHGAPITMEVIMPPRTVPYPQLPLDTARVARSVYNREHLYLLIGDRLDLLCADVSWQDLTVFGGSDARSLFTMAMLTLFQFAEDVPDRQAADALRTRLDWKYALHLPLDYPGLDPARLAEFRQRLTGNEVGERVLGCLLDRLESVGLLGGVHKRGADARRVLWTVEALNRLERAQTAMSLALEALAANDPDWLRRVGSPHWHARYGREVSIKSLLQRNNLAAQLEALGADIAHLLSVVRASGHEDMAHWPEMLALQSLWEQTYGAQGPAHSERPDRPT